MSTTTGSKSKRDRQRGTARASKAVKGHHRCFRAGLPSGRQSEGLADRWDQWVAHLAGRQQPVGLDRLVPRRDRSPLVWSLAEPQIQPATRQLVDQLFRLAQGRAVDGPLVIQQLQQWMVRAEQNQPSVDFAVQSLAWCHALPMLARLLEAGPWWELVELLHQTARDAAAIRLDEHPLQQQLLAGELPWTLAMLLPELDECRQLARPARASLSLGLVELLDGEGLPRGRHLPLLRPLLAAWTRCSLLAEANEASCFHAAAEVQYEWLVRQALRLSRPDGSGVLAGTATSSDRRLLSLALDQGGDITDEAIAARILPRGVVSANGATTAELPPAALHSEWARVAVLRTDWSRSAVQLTVDYDGDQLRSEFSTGGQVLWSGPCQLELIINGQRLTPTEPWEEICWHTDELVDYLELEQSFAGGWTVQRQMLLARQDRLLLLADAVAGPEPAEIRYRSLLPLAQGVTFKGASETHEGYLGSQRRHAAVLPMALPEWRQQRDVGSLAAAAGGLELVQRRRGQRLYAPLVFDAKPQRLGKPLTWRQLTVGHQLQVQPPDVAVGYRLQVGRSQWLIYRSLAPRASRTVLGQNISSEFYIGRFLSSGEAEELLQIE